MNVIFYTGRQLVKSLTDVLAKSDEGGSVNLKYYTGKTVSDIIIDALAKTKTNKEFEIVRGILDRFAASDTEIVNCEYCEHYNGGCCTRFGKMEHPARNDNDFCSRGNRRDGND